MKQQSVSEKLGDSLIVRAPDKMIDVNDGCILLAYRDLLIYTDVAKYGVFEGPVPQEY